MATKLIEGQESMACNRGTLSSIPGIGDFSAAGVITLFTMIGRLERKHLTGLAGRAPITRQSGKWQGKVCRRSGRM